MAVSFDPRSNPVQGASIQANPTVRPAPSGIANAPSSIESQEIGGFCGWIAKLCQWIRSLFSPLIAPSFEERMQKGQELIDIVLRVPPQCDPDRTVMVCELRYNDQVEVVYGKMSTEADHFKEGCRSRLSNLLANNEHIANGVLSVKSYFCEKLADHIHYRTTEHGQTFDFKHREQIAHLDSEGLNLQLASIAHDVQKIYHPNSHDGASLFLLLSRL